MKVKTVDNVEYEWKISEKIAKGNKRDCSKGHNKTRELLKEHFPTSRIYEEVPILVEKKKTLYLDFYLPTYNLAVEVNGKQHSVQIAHFHTHKKDFLVSQKNDILKCEWCELNNITLIKLPYNGEDTWMELIQNYNKPSNC